MTELLHALGGFHVATTVEGVLIATGLIASLVGLWLALDALLKAFWPQSGVEAAEMRERRRAHRREDRPRSERWERHEQPAANLSGMKPNLPRGGPA